ncbi:MAG: ABC transporter substrate-binding protein, partial [Alphaproteobacteria bacterium]
DKMRFTVIRDRPKALEAFKRGELDRFNVTQSEYWYDKLPNSDQDVQNGYIAKDVFYNVHPQATYGLYINTTKNFLDNQDVRTGIQYASNFQLVIDKLFRGDYTRKNTSADGFGVFSHPDVTAHPFDIAKAEEYFAKAGFTKRGPDGVLVNDQGERLSFQLTTGYETFKDVLTILREEALKAGLEFRLEVLDSTAGWKKVQEKKHDLMFTAFGTPNVMYPSFWQSLHSDNAYDKAFLEDGSVNPERKIKTQTNNFFILADPEMDAMIDQYRTSGNKEEMIDLSHRIIQREHDLAIYVPGWNEPFYRTAHWRWLRYPEGVGNVKHSEYDWQWFVHWIDEDMKEETLQARQSGETFPVEINVYDKYKDEVQ